MHEFVWATRLADSSLQVELREDYARMLWRVVAEFVEVLAKDSGGGLLGRKPELANTRLFPGSAKDRRASADFRERHGTAMRARVATAADRMLASCQGETKVVLDKAAVRDWFVVLAHAQSMYLQRPRWRALSVADNSDRRVRMLLVIQGIIAEASISTDGRAPSST